MVALTPSTYPNYGPAMLRISLRRCPATNASDVANSFAATSAHRATLAVLAAALATTAACADSHAIEDPADARTIPPDSDAAGPGSPDDKLGNLAPARSARTPMFTTSDECAFCHAAGASPTVLRDSAQRDVSPFTTWRASMMALSARDPYYLAVLEHELASHPGAETTVMQTCTRCHAPAANVELAMAGRSLDYRGLTTGTTNEAAAGRDGVTCTVCHQITELGLGTASSFTGKFSIGTDRRIFGPHAEPFAMPMQQRVGYTPTASAHVLGSGLCGSCHTVITRALDSAGEPTGPEFLEQGPFVEWSVSAFAAPGGATCQDCHMPTLDDDGVPIATVLATTPPRRLAPRAPFGRHLFVGANAMMLRLLAGERAWAGFETPAEDLSVAADRAEASLRSAARIAVVDAARDGNHLVVRVRVDNLAGHKLPTGYPSRRVWLHVRVSDEKGALVFESGAHRGGRIVGGQGEVLDGAGSLFPHRTTISSSSEVQVWEAVPGDSRGHIAANLLNAVSYLKDNRILPRGFDATDPRAVLARPVGIAADGDFGSSDDVLVDLAEAPPGCTIDVELLYQTARPAELDLLAEHSGPAALRFLGMLNTNVLAPIVVARVSSALP